MLIDKLPGFFVWSYFRNDESRYIVVELYIF